MPPPRCGCEGRASTTLLHSNGTVGVVIIASSVACRRGPAVPCAVCGNRAEPTAPDHRRFESHAPATGGERARLGRRVTAYRNADPQSNPTIAIAPFHSTNRPASDPFPSSEPEHTVRRAYYPREHLSYRHLRLRLDARTATGGALNGQRPNAVNRATLPAAPNGWNARGNAHPCPRRAGGISIYTLQLSFLGH